MQSAQQHSQVELGLGSMVDILSNIANGSAVGNSFLNILSKDFFNYKENAEISLIKLIMVSNKKFDAMKEMLFVSKTSNFLLTDILTNINEFTKKKKSEDPDVNKYLKFFSTHDAEQKTQIINSPQNIAPNKDTNILGTISSTLTNIFNHLSKKKPVTDKKETSSTETSSTETSSIFSGLIQFADSLVLIKKHLNNKLVKSIDTFLKSFDNILSATTKDKLRVFGGSMLKFGETVAELGKLIKEPAKSMMYLAGSFILLSLALISPMFAGGLLILTGFVMLLTKISGNKELTPGMQQFGLGILAITAGLLLMQFVSWESGAKMLLFIGGLNLALKGFSGPGGMGTSIQNSPMTIFAVGIAMLTLSMLVMQYVPWEAGAKMVLFIMGLGMAMKFVSGPRGMGSSMKNSPMLIFATGIAILTLTLFAINEVPWNSIFKMIFFIGSLGLVMKLFNFNKMGPLNSMFGFAFGLGLFILAILAFDELPWEAMLKTIVFIGALGLVMKLFNFNKMGPANSMISFSFGFAIMVLAMYAIEELPWSAMFKTLLFLGGLGIVMKLFGKVSGLNFLGLSAGIVLLSGALWVFKKIGWTMSDALIFGATLAIISGVVALAGIPVIAAAIGLGSLAVIGMSVSLLVAAGSLWLISKLEINFENLKSFGIAVGLLAVGMAAITPFAVLGLVGALALIPIAVASLLAAGSLYAISNLTINTENIDKFSGAVRTLSLTYASNLPYIILGAVGAVAFLPVAMSSLMGIIVMKLISVLEINTDNVAKYGLGIKTLVNAITDIGIVSIGEAVIKSALLVPIFGSALLGGLVLKLISSLNIDENKVTVFGTILSNFTTTIADVLSANEEKLAKAQPGINALAKLMNISGSLAKTIQLMANMQFYEYGVQDGKLVLKGVRTLTSDDFKRVGENLGTMLQTLIEPLTILGSNSDKFVIGGKVIANPFKSSTALKGIEMLAAVGNAFKPLAESVKTYSSIPMVSNPALLDLFKNSLIVMISTFMWAFSKFATIDINLMNGSIQTMVKFIDMFKGANTQKIESLNNIFEKFMNTLSDDVKWKKINNNLNIVKKNFQEIAKSINSIDINKATVFERNMKNLINNNNSDSLRKAVEALAELLGMIKENQENILSAPTEAPSISNGFNLFNKNTPATVDDKNKKTLPATKNNENLDAQIVSVLSEIASKIGLTNNKLENLKVRVIGANVNSL